MFPVAASTSTKIGTARSYRMLFAEATNENGEVITKSPSVTPAAMRARWSAAVPPGDGDGVFDPDVLGEPLLEPDGVGPRLS